MNMLGRKVSFRCGLMAVAAFLLAATVQAPARAAPPVPSLDIVPADAAFYSVMLRNRERYDAIANSKAVAKIRDLPYVQMGLALYQIQAADPDSPVGKFETALRDPEVKKSLSFLGDLVSNEVFVFGGKDFSESVGLMQDTYNSLYFEGVVEGIRNAAQPGAAAANSEDAQARFLVRALVKQIDRIKVPELVIGFKINDKALAKEQLEQTEANVKELMAQAPPEFKNCLKQATVDGHSYLTINLDGAMVPWDDEVVEKIRTLAATPADGDKLIERLKKTKLVFSLGLRDDYVLLAIGPSTDVLARLGKGATLRSRPELAAVAKFADKRICAVDYVSKSLRQRLGQTKGDIDNLLVTAKNLLPALPVPDKLREQIGKDADGIAADIKKLIPEVGAAASLAFLTDSGVENYAYDWSEHPELDASKPLDLLKHVGGNPIAATVGRSKFSREDYDLLLKWCGIGQRYFEDYGVPQIQAQMEPKERAEFDKVYAAVKPLLSRLNKATRELLIPALADGQAGLVIDAKLSSQQYLKALPATEQPLPMLEPAIVVGVSDAAKLKQAFTEYYAVADDFVEVLKGIEKSEVPKDFKIPRPTTFDLGAGTGFGYPLPAEWGVDAKVQPNAALSDKVAVLSLSRGHSRRLLNTTQPIIAGHPLPTDRPLAAVGGLDFAALIDILTPWVDLALDQATAELSPQDAQLARQHTKAAVEVLKVFRGSVSETYVEGKVTVTHVRSEFHDIGE